MLEICRVCRSEATEDQPLFYPCKCSGSIRYVHQECPLYTILTNFHNRYCELCHHPFTFTPIYREDMPERIPIRLFVTQFILRTLYVLLTIMRTIFVAIIWLVVVPYTALWIWRFYFWSGENIVINHRANMPTAENSTMQNPA
ncbi:hypothetical protein INT43_005875, partial [Umbelopsis isabellina]